MAHRHERGHTMSHSYRFLFVILFSLLAFSAATVGNVRAADDSKAQQAAKPVIKKEATAGEMKKDRTMKEDPSKGAKPVDRKTQAKM